MAKLMFGISQTKQKKKAEAKIARTKSGLKRVTITDTVESIVRSDQHHRDQKYKQTKRETRKSLKHVTQGETGEMAVRKQQANREKQWKQRKRETKKNLKHVTQGETGEMAIRKQQANREKRWKETGRNQIKTNSKFDMARSLFGGGDPLPTSSFGKDVYDSDKYQYFYEDEISEYYDEEFTDYSDVYEYEDVIIVVDEDYKHEE
jgi:DNA repair exonuclease SbcCD ATPase subunit